MACNEDCDQILLAGNKTSDEGWRENGESLEIWGKSLYSLFLDRFVSRRRWRRIAGGLGRGGDLGQQRCGQVNHLIFISSFSLQLETVFCSRGWESWEEAGSQDLASEEIPENIFEIMRNGTLSQVNTGIV